MIDIGSVRNQVKESSNQAVAAITAAVVAGGTIAVLDDWIKSGEQGGPAALPLLMRRYQNNVVVNMKSQLDEKVRQTVRRESKRKLSEPYLTPVQAAEQMGLSYDALQHWVSRYPAIAEKHSMVSGHRGRPRKGSVKACQRRWTATGVAAFIREVQSQ